jgi:hypothetical protein
MLQEPSFPPEAILDKPKEGIVRLKYNTPVSAGLGGHRNPNSGWG